MLNFFVVVDDDSVVVDDIGDCIVVVVVVDDDFGLVLYFTCRQMDTTANSIFEFLQQLSSHIKII
jgi:hypothetical protein